jgi:glutathione S-transferase
MLRIWGRKTSSNVQAVMWTVAELGLPYERYDFGHTFGGVDTPEFLAMNPNGLVPVVRDGDDEPLWESGAIVRYLASRYGRAPFWPENLSARAQIDKWAEWAKINVALNFAAPIFTPLIRVPERQRNPAAIRSAIGVLDRYLEIAETQLARGSYLCGEDFTLADIQFGTVLYRYFTLDIERRAHAGLEAYYQRLVARPAYREHVMVSYDDLRAVE